MTHPTGPSARLLQLHARYLADRQHVSPPPTGLSGSLFAAWLEVQGIAPSDFAERDWEAFLGLLGIHDPDRQADFIESLAEWGGARGAP